MNSKSHTYRIGDFQAGDATVGIHVFNRFLPFSKAAVLLVVVFSQWINCAFAQKITVSFDNAPLKAVIAELGDKSGYTFLYDQQYLKTANPVTLAVKDQPILTILEQVFANQPFVFQVLDKMITIKAKSPGRQQNPAEAPQRKSVSGKVTDSIGEPLASVTVRVEGKNKGTVTDRGGRFALDDVEDGSILIISIIGSVSRKVAISRQEMHIVLQRDFSTLDEVVVVGFGTQKKVNLTGAVSSVSSDVLENRPVTNISQALQGVVPNLNVTVGSGQPNAFANYNIRGATSMSLHNDNNNPRWLVDNGSPLILVDNIEMENFNFSALNPNDIDNISVIKDASASAIYGARAAYGVILVTTKKGKAGQSTVAYAGDIQWNRPSSRPNFMDAYTAEYAHIMSRVYTGGTMTTEDEQRLEGIRRFQANPIPENAWMYVPGTNEQSITWVGDYNPYDLIVKDWAPIQKHNVSLSGGTEALRYYGSFGYQDQDGFYNYRNDNMKRYNGMLNVDAKVNTWFNIAFKLNYNATNYHEPLPYAWKGSVWPVLLYQRLWNVNQPVWTGPTDPIPNAPTNSIVSAYANSGRYADTKRSVAIFTASPEFIITKDIKLKADISYRPSTYDYKNVEPEYRYIFESWQAETIGTFTNTGSIWDTKESVRLLTNNIYLDFNKRIDRHQIAGIVGFNQEVWNLEQLQAYNQGIISLGAPTLGNTYGDNRSIDERDEHWAVRGGFLRLNYNYADKYIVEMNGRYDGSSRFPSANRFKFFPSFSGGWRISEEPFFKGNIRNWIDNLKIRASYGAIGNQNVANYGFYPTMVAERANYLIDGARPYKISPPGLVNPNFTWETATTINGGLDLTLLKGRVDLSLDVYQRKTTDIIMAGATYPAVLGADPPTQNSGALQTNGWELSLGYKDRTQTGFNYDFRFVLSDYTSKVLEFRGNDNNSLSSLYSGMQVGEIWGYETDRILQAEDIQNNLITRYTGENNINLHRPHEYSGAYFPGDIMYKDRNGDGRVDRGSNTLDDHGDLMVIGNSTPRLSFGLTSNFSYKGFDLSLFFQGIGKRDVWIGDMTWRGDIDGSGNWDVYNQSWTPERTNAKYPMYNGRRSQNWLPQTAYLFDGRYLRLKQAILGYTVPFDKTSAIGIQRLRFTVSGFNIFEITKLPRVYDPDLLDANYPQMRSLALGVQVRF
ncbi:TonB-dependent receptor [Sphingobacterium paludis]|uniref:TonB-linked SusC/RagA family outer membrane protein n=1 Tax=Sphingobacterium paludis TaxID=1476465 RepID=A0A4R7CWD9_9SPHI|nr:TonB-dependent receptor [Sphingobacterium paludis]TDS12177.1 TonB-linked SusC/RagA family outer membrane protein [Sphingobacterium paludis]